MTYPLCFVLMPFGKERDSGGVLIDFDAAYKELIVAAIDGARLQPVRANEEMTVKEVGSPEKNARDQTLALGSVKSWLTRKKGRLLILAR